MNILPKIRTSVELNELLNQIDQFGTDLFRTDVFPQAPDLIANELTSVSNKSELLAKIREELLRAKIFKITVSFEPTNIFADKVSAWVKQNVGSDVVVDFEIDPEIIAGAVITFSGRFTDYSYKDKINEAINSMSKNL